MLAIHIINVIVFVYGMQRKNLPEWEKLLSSAAHLQRILPEAVLEGASDVAFTHFFLIDNRQKRL